MKRIRLTVKNYRCFDEENPLRLELGPGFTAFVGPNNSGKSSGLRLIYEMRPLWSNIKGNITTLAAGSEISLGSYLSVSDLEEIFCNTSNRPISIELELLDVEDISARTITSMVCTTEKSRPGAWKFKFSSKGSNEPLPFREDGTNNPYLYGLPTGGAGSQAIHNCLPLIETLEALEGSLYIGPFRNAINEGGGSYFDLQVGASFISTWNSWKTGDSKAQNRAVAAATSDIEKIFEYERLEINAAEKLKTLQLSINGKPYRLAEMGAGLSQFIIVLGNAATRRSSFILVDEPELNLHPSLQIDFLTSLASYSQYGVVFATHSIGLARSTAERIYSFQKTANGSVVKPFEQTPNYSEFIGELSFSSFKEMGCDRILLVEGVTEVKTIQQFLRLLKKDHRIVMLPLGGDSLAAEKRDHELAELMRLSSNISALVDSEREGENEEAAQRRQAFAALCKKLGIDACLTQRRATENYFTERAVKAALGDTYSGLGHYQLLKDCPKPWGKNDNWKIARQMTLDELMETDIGAFLEKL